MTEFYSIQQVFGQLASEGRVSADWQSQAADALESKHRMQPWYVRAMVGFGAWFASLLLIGFIFAVEWISTPAGRLGFGIFLLIAAIALCRMSDNDFSRQAALAMSLAGQAFLAFGVGSLEHRDEFEAAMLTLIIVNSILLTVYPDSVHRFLSVLIIVANSVGLLYFWHIHFLLPWLTLLLTAAFVSVVMHEAVFLSRGWGKAIRPIETGLMVSAFGTVMLAAVYIFPELVDDFRFYPRPWIATLGCGAILLYLEVRLLAKEVLGGIDSKAAFVVYGMTLVVVLSTLPAPGLLFSLSVVLIGAAWGDRPVLGAGMAFLAAFTTAFFYGIETSLIMKSVILVATGLIVLMGRWLLIAVWQSERKGDYA